MTIVKCLIVDDEVIAQNIIEGYIEPLDQFQLIGKCSNALEANNLLNNQSIDLIFLDLEMPNINGLAFLKNLSNPPKVIITTAYREYAIEGFDLDVVDYLLKPISHERFLKAVNKVLTKAHISDSPGPYIYLKVDMKMVKVIVEDILYIEGLSNYVKIFTSDKTLISYQKLSLLEEVLPSDQFRRSHRSYIINVNQITAFTSNDIEIGGLEIPIGGKYKAELLELLERKKI